ncbi:HTH-type transcriptional repressor YtrA [Rubripirellula lacrimiformis]|uniref:HTH-type transcriptional repressor YtrA n=1 Tax=Rubripirellula lacrimiformis TaxID=1930273 RepID=A0A517NJ22_9BACT|nr:GntR family transcriptional regulator [Rubripirellula lacrimiformis]QDT07141.1 HTH-type transcriptional repressor YtrA [Rubripirellula lacrimiformis]
MFLSIDFQSDVAIYLQIVRQIKASIAAGTMRSGQLLPSGRVLSGQLAINPNTVARAFTELQNDGVIESLRGRGMVISSGAAAICRRHRDGVLAERIGGVLAEAWNAGLDAEAIESIVHSELKKLSKTTPNVHVETGPAPASEPATANSTTKKEG